MIAPSPHIKSVNPLFVQLEAPFCAKIAPLLEKKNITPPQYPVPPFVFTRYTLSTTRARSHPLEWTCLVIGGTMATEFVAVKDDDQIEALAALANSIWHEYWPDIISLEQTDYMVEKFQSKDAIVDQVVNKGYEYYFVKDDNESVGFIGLQPSESKLFLSKLYISKENRGKGYSSAAFTFLEGICRDRTLDAIWLTVNKNNHRAIDVYKVKGFETVRTQTVDIGEGFVMDDFVMEKLV
jgi:diamine N-acetyltransferase